MAPEVRDRAGPRGKVHIEAFQIASGAQSQLSFIQ
jgi:hypothetical protein